MRKGNVIRTNFNKVIHTIERCFAIFDTNGEFNSYASTIPSMSLLCCKLYVYTLLAYRHMQNFESVFVRSQELAPVIDVLILAAIIRKYWINSTIARSE